MEIVVVLIVVKKFGFLVITRDHGSFWGHHQVEILPTGLPELFKPARDLLEPTKTTRTTRTTTTGTTKPHDYLIFSVFLCPITAKFVYSVLVSVLRGVFSSVPEGVVWQ